jgi:opacity protein-like surface antigen
LAGLLGLGALVLQGGPARADHYDYSSWRSLYVGGLVGYHLIGNDVHQRLPLPEARASTDLDGFAGSLVVGYRRPMYDHFLIGAEADFTVGDNRGSALGYRYVADWAVSLKAIAGVFVRPGLLLYATGGIGWLGVNSAPFRYPTGLLSPDDPRVSATLLGGVVGAGIEWETGHGFNVRAEYLYGAYEGWRPGTDVREASVDNDMHQLRIGVVISLDNPYDPDDGKPRHGGDLDRDRYWRKEPLK